VRRSVGPKYRLACLSLQTRILAHLPLAQKYSWRTNLAQWSARWNRTGDYRRPRILYLADRNVLVDDPKDKLFAAKQPDADPFDLLCHVAFNAPLRTRRERAEALRRERK
jgi:type I site-specific restriction endonuclease